MRRRVPLIAGAVLLAAAGAFAYWQTFVRPLTPEKFARETARLSAALEAEILDFEAPREREVFLLEPVHEGEAAELYREALDALEERGDPRNWVSALGDWKKGGIVPPPAVREERKRLESVLALVSLAARARRASPLRSVREGPWVPQRGRIDPDTRLTMMHLLWLLELDCRFRIEEGDLSGALDRILESRVLERDGWPGRRGLGVSLLPLLPTIEPSLSAADLDRAVEFLRRDLEHEPPSLAVAESEFLVWQVAFRRILEGGAPEADYETVPRWRPRPPLIGPSRAPSAADILRAWIRLREALDRIRDAVPPGDPGRLESICDELYEEARNEPSGPFAAAVMYFLPGVAGAERMYRTARAEEEALLRSLLLLREQRGAAEDRRPPVEPEESEEKR
jgi:hypothetical protein